jgi:hypothetical protein
MEREIHDKDSGFPKAALFLSEDGCFSFYAF